jgi:hydroxymethylbilane synthase
MAIARPLRVGTRGSKLALAQTEWVVKALLTRHPDLRIETVIIRTKGDVIADRPFAGSDGQGLFRQGN